MNTAMTGTSDTSSLRDQPEEETMADLDSDQQYTPGQQANAQPVSCDGPSDPGSSDRINAIASQLDSQLRSINAESDLEGDVAKQLRRIARTAKESAKKIGSFIRECKKAVEMTVDPDEKARLMLLVATSPLIDRHDRNVSEAAELANRLAGQMPPAAPSYARIVTRGAHQQQDATRQRRKPAASRRRPSGNGNIMLQLTAKTQRDIDPIKVHRDATRGMDVHVAKVTTLGSHARIHYWLHEHAEKAKQAIEKHSVNGVPATDLYETKVVITAKHSVKTAAFNKRVLDLLPFYKAGKVDRIRAAEVLSDANSCWFESTADIEAVEVNSVARKDEALYIVEIYMSEAAIKRFNARAERGKATINLGRTIVEAWTTVKCEPCYRCLQYGHWRAQCRAPKARCRYCGDDHDVTKCSKKDDPTCPICQEFNSSLRHDQRPRDTDHPATSTRCPAVRQAKRDMRAAATAGGKRRHHV